MKILVTITYYHPHWTGLTAYAKRIAEGLAARGHQVTVLTSRYKPELPADEMINGVRVIRMQPVARVSRTVVMPQYPLQLARLLREHDLVHLHTPLPETALITSMARAMGKVSLITHQGDVVMPQGLLNQAIQVAMDGTMSLGFQLANRVVVHSADYGRHSQFLAPVAYKLDAIYPPVEIPPPQPEAVAAWRHELHLDGKKLVGFAGRFVEEKGFDFLLQAMPLVRERMPEAHFVYAGETNVVYEHFFERCRPMIEQNRASITMVGLLTDQQRLANFYAMCDLFVLPSRTDCFPSVQIEALLSGTPLVTSDIPGAREVLQMTGMGRLVAARDPQALADGIVEVLGDSSRYQPTRAAVRRVFNTPRSLDEYEQLMQQLVDRRQPDSDRVAGAQAQARESLRTLVGGATLASAPLAASLPAQNTQMSRLSADDRIILDRLLRNEADMAFRRRAITLLEHLDLQDGDTVLDCGCGMGVYLMMMGRLRNLKLYGVDGDLARLEWARNEQVPAGLADVDIHKLPFADASFDKILMSEVLEHLAEDRDALREIARVLKPGGVLALSVPHANYPFWWDPINKTLEALNLRPLRGAGPITGLWSNHWRLYRPADLRSVIEGAGLVIEDLREQTHYSFPFIHLLVYSIGKPLIEHNLLPPALRNAADRFRGEQNSGSLFNPINLGLAVLRAFDRPNEHLRGTEQTFVNIVVRARKL